MPTSPPIIKVQRLANHPRRTAFIVVIAAIALCIAVIVIVRNYEANQTNQIKLINSSITANRVTLDHNHSTSNARWCGLFRELIVQNTMLHPNVTQVRAKAAAVTLAEHFDCTP